MVLDIKWFFFFFLWQLYKNHPFAFSNSSNIFIVLLSNVVIELLLLIKVSANISAFCCRSLSDNLLFLNPTLLVRKLTILWNSTGWQLLPAGKRNNNIKKSYNSNQINYSPWLQVNQTRLEYFQGWYLTCVIQYRTIYPGWWLGPNVFWITDWRRNTYLMAVVEHMQLYLCLRFKNVRLIRVWKEAGNALETRSLHENQKAYI